MGKRFVITVERNFNGSSVFPDREGLKKDKDKKNCNKYGRTRKCTY